MGREKHVQADIKRIALDLMYKSARSLKMARKFTLAIEPFVLDKG